MVVLDNIFKENNLLLKVKWLLCCTISRPNNWKFRKMGIMAGANVVMPNLSPIKSRKLYDLYENKICTGDEAAECRSSLEKNMKKILKK